MSRCCGIFNALHRLRLKTLQRNCHVRNVETEAHLSEREQALSEAETILIAYKKPWDDGELGQDESYNVGYWACFKALISTTAV